MSENVKSALHNELGWGNGRCSGGDRRTARTSMTGRAHLRVVAFLALTATVFACSSTDTTSPRSYASSAPYDSLFAAIGGAIDDSSAFEPPTDSTGGEDTTSAGDDSVATPTAAIDTVLLLKRTAPLEADISLTAVIGPEGGEIRIREAGGKIDIPAGALKDSVTITMTAKAGWDVAYEFQPHGLVFDLPVKLQQDLRGTFAYLYPSLIPTLQGSYYDTSLSRMYCGSWNLFGRVKENMPASYDNNVKQLKFEIHHFSGYLLSSGFKGGWGDEPGWGR
jgi:hypothetical protein